MTIVLKYIFLHIPKYARLSKTRHFVRQELLNQGGIFVLTLGAILWVEFRVDDQLPWLMSFFGQGLYSILFFGVPLILHLTTKKHYALVFVLLGLVWSSSPTTPSALVNADGTALVLSTIFFIVTSQEYVDGIVDSIQEDDKQLAVSLADCAGVGNREQQLTKVMEHKLLDSGDDTSSTDAFSDDEFD